MYQQETKALGNNETCYEQVTKEIGLSKKGIRLIDESYMNLEKIVEDLPSGSRKKDIIAGILISLEDLR